jgi:hypothetical protein
MLPQHLAMVRRIRSAPEWVACSTRTERNKPTTSAHIVIVRESEKSVSKNGKTIPGIVHLFIIQLPKKSVQHVR